MIHCNITRVFRPLLLALLVITQARVFAGTHSRVRRMIHGTKFYTKSPIVFIRTKHRMPGNDATESTCSGSLITTQHVLSAAHCFTKNIGSRVTNKTIVEVNLYMGLLGGNRDLQKVTMRGMDEVEGSARYTVGMDAISIQEHWYHSLAYKRHFKHQLNDIAVIKLPRPVDLSTTNVVTATLFAPKYTNWYPNFISATAMGWGLLQPKTPYSSGEKGLRKADITTESLASCKSKARKMRFHRGTMMIADVFCGLGIRERSTSMRPQICFGDSGGPLFLKHAPGHVQLGVNVWVGSKCDRNFNGFLRIANHIDFVKKVVGLGYNLEISNDLRLITA